MSTAYGSASIRLTPPAITFGNTSLAMDGIRPRPLMPATNPIHTRDSSPSSTDTQTITDRLLWRWGQTGSVIAVVGLSAVIGHNLWTRYEVANQTQVEYTAAVASTSSLTGTPAQSTIMDGAQSLLATYTSRFPGSPGITITDLATNKTTGVNEHQVFTSASLYKLFVAFGVYQQIDAGRISLARPIGNATVGSCLDKMIAISDNPCGVALGNLIGWETQNSKLQEAGFMDTALARNSSELTSSADVARLFQQLYAGSLLSSTTNEHFLNLLKNQKINNRLPNGLPPGTLIAHKTGDLDGLVHDAGIVYSPGGNYVVSVLSGPWASPKDAPPVFSELSTQLYNLYNSTR